MQKITFLFFLVAFLGCDNDSTISNQTNVNTEEDTVSYRENSLYPSDNNNVDIPTNENNEISFISGLWKPKSIIDSLKNGHLLLSEDWIHFETYESDGVKKFMIQDYMDYSEYILEESPLGDFEFRQNGEVIPMGLSFNYAKFYYTNLDESIEIVKVDQKQVTKQFYFHGNYKVEYGDKTTNVTLDRNSSMLGFIIGDKFDAHYGHAEPVFVVKQGEVTLETFILKDTDFGFELFVCTNCDEIDGIDFPVETGKLKYTFIKK